MIERKYVRLRKDVVVEYRRIKTPFFYINLKPKEYEHYDYETPYIPSGIFGNFLLPEGQTFRNVGWKNKKGDYIMDKDIESILDTANASIKDNILRLEC